MKRYWGGVASLSQLALLVRHIVQWTETKGAHLRGADYLHRWALGLIPDSRSPSKDEDHLRIIIPKLAADYVEKCQSGTINEVDFIRDWNLSQFLKKFRFECDQSPEVSEQGFWERNQRCREVYLSLDDKGDKIIRIRMRELLKRALPPVGEREGRFGPGATLNAGSTWAEKLKWLSTYHRWHRIWDRRCSDDPSTSKLHVVPKDFNKNRTITIETCEDQWSQQGARSTILASIHKGCLRGTVMDLGLKAVDELPSGVAVFRGVLLDSVRKQQSRCRQGALDGHLVTIDLSDASDTVMRDLVFEVFPSWVCQLIEPCRAEWVESSRGQLHELFMYAGMGNATTFVVETLYFWALLTAIGEECHLGKPDVTVFGDDIVMNGKVARSRWFQERVARFGLKLNLAKSGLSAGPGFREACGEVAYGQTSTSSTFRFYGYAATKEGAIGYCDITSRLIACIDPTLNALGLCLLTWEGRPKAPLVTVDNGYESSLCYRIPHSGIFYGNGLPLRPCSRSSVRWNKALQRIELRLPTVEAKTARITIKDPCWGPGVVRSWGYWAYQLSLNQCTPIYGSRQLPKAREVTYAIPHRTKVRNRWIPSKFTCFEVM